MPFSAQHGITRPAGADWFDANVEMDSPLYVDPFLVFDDHEDPWAGAHDELVRFFDAGNVDTGKPGSTVHWYASKADVRSSRVPGTVCYSGTVWDKAAYNKDFKITGKTWEPSFGRRIHLQRKSGRAWKTVKSAWTKTAMVSPNFVICIKQLPRAVRDLLPVQHNDDPRARRDF